MNARRVHYKPKVISVSELIASAGYYGHFDEPYPADPGYHRVKGTWAGDCADLMAQGFEPNVAESLRLVAFNHSTWDVSRWPGFVEAYRSWLGMLDAGGSLIETQRYRYSEIEALQGTADQLWLLPQPSTHAGIVRLDIKCMEEGPVAKVTELQLGLYDLMDNVRATWFLGLALHPDGTCRETWWRPFQACQDARLAIRGYHRVFGPETRYR